MRRVSLRTILCVSALFVAGCSSIRLDHAPRAAAGNWTLAGGTIERTNAARAVLRPPLDIVWKHKSSAAFGPAALAATDSLLFLGNLQGEISVLDMRTGHEIADDDFGSEIAGTPLVDGEMMYIALSHDEENLLAYNTTTGTTAWTAKIGPIETSPLLLGTALVVATVRGQVISVDKETGVTKWTYKLPPRPGTAMIHSTPAGDSSSGTIVFGSDGGILTAVSADSGALRWQVQAASSVLCSPAISESTVYVAAREGTFAAYKLATGTQLWKRDLAGKVYSAPAVGASHIYIGTSASEVIALEKSTGAIAWRYRAASVVSAAPLLSGDIVYAGSLDKNLYAFDARDGSLRWTLPFNGRIKTTPVAHDGYLFVLTDDRFVYALREAAGEGNER